MTATNSDRTTPIANIRNNFACFTGNSPPVFPYIIFYYNAKLLRKLGWLDKMRDIATSSSLPHRFPIL
jgi:hypothetical protein